MPDIEINPDNIPQHIAIIMDGNGRWAKERGQDRVFGHHEGVVSVREIVNACAELGVKYLTLYAFSTENWNRPKHEVDALMQLLVSTLNKEFEELHKNNVCLKTAGNFADLPTTCRQELAAAIEKTKSNKKLTLILALSYSSRWEIIQATQKIVQLVANQQLLPQDITQELFEQQLTTAGIPDPELMIRTSGEHRISNFLLYQLAYSELYFTPVHWPDFRKPHLIEAIADYQQRERRFGKTSEQIQNSNSANA